MLCISITMLSQWGFFTGEYTYQGHVAETSLGRMEKKVEVEGVIRSCSQILRKLLPRGERLYKTFFCRDTNKQITDP